MAILSLQSQVAFGHVGNSAAVFTLQRLGFDVWPIPTTLLSNHPGHGQTTGRTIDRSEIDGCVDGLAALGIFDRCRAVLSGYLGQAETGQSVLRALSCVRRAAPGVLWCCDPVMGDNGAPYVAQDIIDFFRGSVAAADILTPNAFELGVLTGASPTTRAGLRRAIAGLAARGPRIILVSSVRVEDTPADAIDTVVADGDHVWRVRTPLLPSRASGTGDVLTALFLGHFFRLASAPAALALSVASVCDLVSLSAGARDLPLVAGQSLMGAPLRELAAEPS